MNIRLLFLSAAEKKILAEDAEIILSKCDKIASVERQEMRENQDFHDGTCPNCRTTKKNKPDAIVNKMREVKGTGKITGGILDITGFVNIETHPVNHCNICGNEWVKFKVKSISQTDVLRVCLNYLAAILNNSAEKKFNWKVEAIKVFDDCYAETIYKFVRKEKKHILPLTKSKLKLETLRQHYTSIFDTENKKKLEKI